MGVGQHVGVQANVVNVATGKEQTTNDFRFTLCTDQNIPLTRKVVPKTYKGLCSSIVLPSPSALCTVYIDTPYTEAMQWLEGRRALEMGAEIRMLRYAADAPGLADPGR